MKIKKILTAFFAVMMFSTCTTAFVGCGQKGGPTDYTLWISTDSDVSGFYATYNDNPVVNYINEKMTFAGNSISLNLTAAPTTGAADNLSTLLATGSYSDLMDISLSSQSIIQLYESGAAMDITDYVKQYMPNYLAYLEANPEYKKNVVTYYDIDGDGELEERFFQIAGFHDSIGEMFQGYQYRRDLIVKGTSFTGGYDSNGVWSDNIIFPSYNTENGKAYKQNVDPTWDGSDPVFISDWEWMLEIFKKQLPADGYGISIFYYGFNPCGELNSGFGGYETGGYYTGADGKVGFSGTSENFKAYLEAMNTWYNNGWLDTKFTTHTNDYFWSIDAASVTTGKVGIWQGYAAQLGNNYVDDIPGSYVAGARLPINDVYGSDAPGGAKYKAGQNEFVPSAMLGNSINPTPWIVTPSAKDKDLETLFTFLDWCLTPDLGGQMLALGLSDAQIAEAKEYEWGKVYDNLGVSSMGTWDDDGMFSWSQPLIEDDSKKAALIGQRLPVSGPVSKIKIIGTDAYVHAQSQWMMYLNKGYEKHGYLENYLSRTQANTYSQNTTYLTDYMQQNVPLFINGKKSLSNDWDTFVSDLNKRGAASNVKLLNDVLDSFN